ncbi:aldehyde dehydrogenase family protein [Burkholderia ambifaria]|uniref:aldehyde dehydrogenase family protein n=1 Tax=Burkholderia ambifaria TaxID=152480 RepID=UPI0022391701|nr:aldehyde dehydrogenase family protein [Burkholderia ambifaria]
MAAARRAFDAGVWAGLNPRARKAVLLRWAALMREHLDELSLLETLDAGKPIGDTTTVDVPGAAYCVEWFAEAIDKSAGSRAGRSSSRRSRHARAGRRGGRRRAVDFPILMAAWKFGPALAAGNSVVLKPSEKSPLTAIRVAQLGVRGRYPGRRVQRRAGGANRASCSRCIATVDCIAFTGSTRSAS